jgi:hypothetical protein
VRFLTDQQRDCALLVLNFFPQLCFEFIHAPTFIFQQGIRLLRSF